MTKLLKPSDIAQRFTAGETIEQIFVDDNGGWKAKLAGPEASVAVSTDTERAVDFIITTEAVDRYSDIVSLGGWRTKNYARNPVVLWAHDDSIPAIARGTNMRTDVKAMRSMAIFAERDYHPLADTVFQLVKAKFIGAASVGFIPLKAKAASDPTRKFGIDIIEQELLEWSVVNIPANPECLVEARSLGIDCVPLIGWAEKTLDEKGLLLLVPRTELEALRRAAGAPAQFKGASVADLLEFVREIAERAPLQRSDSSDWVCGAAHDLPVDNTDGWDGPAAAKRMLDAAGFDGDKPDVAKAKRGFLAHDAANPTLRGSYKLPFADLVGGELKAVAGGIRAAASRLPQTDISQSVKDVARGVLDGYESKLKTDDKSAPARTVKSLWHVAWLADILMDLDMLEDCVAWEAAMEEDGSPIPQKLLEALKALGQILVDMTKEEVAELLSDEEGGENIPAGEPIALSAVRLQTLRLLVDAKAPVIAAVNAALTPAPTGGLVDLIAAKDAIAAALKAGRVISADNEKKLRSAHDHMTQACEIVMAICDSASGEADDDGGDDGGDDAGATAKAIAIRQRAARAKRLKFRLRSEGVAA